MATSPIERTALAVNRLDVDWQGARANASGTIGLTGRRAIDLAVRADALQVSGLLSAIERGDLPVTGTLSAIAQVAGTIANPSRASHRKATTWWPTTKRSARSWPTRAWQAVSSTSRRCNWTSHNPKVTAASTATGSYHLDSQRYTVDLRSQDVKLLTLRTAGSTVVSPARLM